MPRRGNKKQDKAVEAGAEETAKKSKPREYFESLIVAIILALFVKTFALQTFQIPTGSMEDGLLIGDHIIVNKLVYGPDIPLVKAVMPMRDVRRGDVVIFKYPDDPTLDYVKRVIGLPGEEVRLYQHQIWIDGVPINEAYKQDGRDLDDGVYTLRWQNADRERAEAIGYDPNDYDPSRDPSDESFFRPMTYNVPEGHYFCMGDHRYISQDGRAWEHKFVPRDNIIGRAVMIYWSYNATREDYHESDIGTRMAGIVKAVLTFPFNTRWNRLLHIIH